MLWLDVTLAALIGIILIVGVTLAVFLPGRAIGRRLQQGQQGQAPDIKDILDAENNLRTTILQTLTALVLVVGGGFTVYQIIDTANTTRSQLNLTEEGQLSQQFTQAAGQLAPGSQQPTQLGGVYSLVRIAHESSGYRAEIVDVLAAFVRNSAGSAQSEKIVTLAMAVRHPSTQAALNALLKPPLAGGGPIRLSNGFVTSLDLRLGDFVNDNAERVVLEGDALDGAAFNGTDLSGACLFGASVNGTMFQGAQVDGADLSGIKNLKDAQTDETTEYDQYTKWPRGFTKQDQMKFGTEKVSTLKPKEAACP